ncbi:hypothetical protein L7F22_003634 [Adiantum nelumboides]|nr:hypothetical protein [Adiantum nelumboides]
MEGLSHFHSYSRVAAALLHKSSHDSNKALQHWRAPTQVPCHLFLHSGISRFFRRRRKRRARYCICLTRGGSPDPSSASEGRERSTECTDGFPNHEALEPPHRTVEFLDQSMEIEKKGLLQQLCDIVMFAGPALGIWLSGPIMSMIDTAVVGNSSLLELAALGPGTVFCDQVGYLFMFLSVATSNLVATSMAKQDELEAANHLSRLLFVGLVCGISMLILTGAFSSILLKAFVGAKNESLLPAACSYVQIRGLAWPAVLVGLVAQSARANKMHEMGESSRPPQPDDDIFRTQLVAAVTMFLQVMQNPRFLAFLQPPLPSQPVGSQEQMP